MTKPPGRQSGAPPDSMLALAPMVAAQADVTLLNVSYDPTRELYEEVYHAFGNLACY